MAVAANADDYAVPRQNMFFPGVIPELDGQCVSLVKWFMGEMSEVPDWNSARGDARQVGKTLVAQGHATEVAYSQRQRGDIICYEYGIYGHIAVQLGGGNVFEQNVNMGGVARKIVDGAYVYASRIGKESEAWRHDAHIYRLKSYNEQGGNMPYPEGQINDNDDIAEIWRGLFFREPSKQELDDNQGLMGIYWSDAIKALRQTEAFRGVEAEYRAYPGLVARVKELEAQLSQGGTELKPGKYVVK